MKDHRSLEAWKEARAVALGVLQASKTHWKPWATALFAQLQRTSLSVQLNIAEGWTFNRSPTCSRYLGIAYGSVVETLELLSLALDAGAIPEGECRRLIARASRSQRLLLGLLKQRRPMS